MKQKTATRFLLLVILLAALTALSVNYFHAHQAELCGYWCSGPPSDGAWLDCIQECRKR